MKLEIPYHRITHSQKIHLPNSKSIENRYLILHFLENRQISQPTSEDSHDVFIFKQNLQRIKQALLNPDELTIIDVEDCGMAWRFFTALLSILKHNWRITGNKRLKKRPISELINTLKSAGADIRIADNGDIIIHGQDLESEHIYCNASKTGQNLSALLLIQPYCHIQNITAISPIASPNYIAMTQQIITDFKNQTFINIEKDWSAAAYWYMAAILNPMSRFIFTGLNENSLQADHLIISIAEQFGIKTDFGQDSISIFNTNIPTPSFFKYDFKNCIDLAPYIITLTALLNIDAEFSGIWNLKYKESNRFKALIENLSQFSMIQKRDEDSLIINRISNPNYEQILHFKTHCDHRIAMSLALAAYRFKKIHLDQTSCVIKSYPLFWNDYTNTHP